MTTQKIALLGASSHIAQGLIDRFLESGSRELFLFARNPDSLKQEHRARCRVLPFEEFEHHDYDATFNCIVARASESTAGRFDISLFRIAERFDNLVLDYSENRPRHRYFHFSSGAVYGNDFTAPPHEDTPAVFPINHITHKDYYQSIKLYQESKHRASASRFIVDLRVFAYFSREIDLNAKFLLSEIVSCLLSDTEFLTDDIDIVRDYIHPDDLYRFVEKLLESDRIINDSFDLYSRNPVKKFEILEMMAREFGLRYRVRTTPIENKIAATKPFYYSMNRKAARFGFAPGFSSLDVLRDETAAILATIRNDADKKRQQ